MRKTLLALTALAGATLPATAANAAVVLVNLNCNLATGCLFNLTSGSNVTESAASVLEVEAAYNNFHTEPPLPATIDLTGLFKTAGTLGTTGGTFTLPGGGLFSFYAVKAGEQFVLYQLPAPVNSVIWTAAQLVNDAIPPQLRAASHIVAYSSVTPVPEPSTWAMFMFGFTAVGYSLRRRKSYRLAQAV